MVSTDTGCPHCSPVALAPVAVAKGEDVGPHDNVKASKDPFHREGNRELVHVESKPAPDGVNPMIIVDVGIHCNGIGRVDDGVICKWQEFF